jgi:MoaA/NifB/PqqE/SkfB family radical SAM enzyme
MSTVINPLPSLEHLADPPRLRGIDYTPQEVNDAVRHDRPLQIGLMVSRTCNLACTYCYTSAGRPGDNELSFAGQKELLKQARELGAKTLWVPGEGEPLLDDNFLELIEYANGLGLYVVFYTNGLLINKDMARRLFSQKVSVVTKLNSFDPQIQDTLCGAKGVSSKLLRAVDNLLDAGFADERRLAIESVIVQQNLQEIPALFKFCRHNSIIPYFEMLLDCGRAPGFDLQVDSASLKSLFSRLLEIDKDFDYTWDPQPPFAAGLWSCDRIVYHMVITSTGTAQPCVALKMPLGNIRTQTLESIWHSGVARGFREAAHEKIALTREHGEKLGCFCSAFIRTGDPFARDDRWY